MFHEYGFLGFLHFNLSSSLHSFNIMFMDEYNLVWWPGQSCVVYEAKEKNSTSLFLLWMSLEASKILTAFTPHLDYDQTAVGLRVLRPYGWVTSAVY
jgi:hypothetical protein